VSWAFGRLLGMRATSVADGQAQFALDVRPDLLNPHGVLHGGVLYSLADTAMGAALHSRLEPGEQGTTLEIKMQYLAPVTGGAVVAEATLVQRTRRTAVLEARVRAGGDRTVALATGTFYIRSVRSE
jgi:acyl-CoA thioesterase